MEQGKARGQARGCPEKGSRPGGGHWKRAWASGRRASILMILGLVAVLLAGPLAASTGAQAASARLHVDGEASYDPQVQWLTASQVRFEQGNVTVVSDRLEADLNRQRATFTGHVTLEAGSGRWEGEELAYDLRTGGFSLEEGRAAVELPGAEGALYLQVPLARGTASQIQMSDARLTTCGCQGDRPEYHLRAREVEIEPGNQMVLHHVVYVEGSVPLFYWPRLTVSLDPEDDLGTSPFQPPEFGWTEEDGWYLRATYYYDTRADRLGALHGGYYQHSGWGLGVTQQLPLGPASGMVGVDWLENPPSEARGREVAQPRYRLQTRLDLPSDPGAPVRASYEATYWEVRPEDAGREDWSLEHDLSLAAALGGTAASLDLHQERGLEDGTRLRREGADLSARQALGPFTLRAEAQGRRWGSLGAAREYLGYQGEVNSRWGPWDAAVRAGWSLHPNLLAYKNPEHWSRFGRNPEAELGYTLPQAWWPSSLNSTRLRLSAQQGRYAEEDVNGIPGGWIGGTHLEARSTGTRIPLNSNLALGVQAWGGGWWYETDQALQYAGSSLALQYRPSGPFRGELGYNIQENWGDSPFEFHKETWEAKEEAQLTLELSTQPVRVGAFGSYDLRDRKMEDVVGLVELKPSERLELGAAAHYDVPQQTWSRYDARMAVGLSENWWLEGAAAYTVDPEEDESPLQGQVSFSYTSDCRTVSLRFDLADRALWFEYRLNAFPSSPLQFGREAKDPTVFQLPDMKAVVTEVTS